MSEPSREQICRKINQDKLLLALTFKEVSAIDTYFKQVWGIQSPITPQKFDKALLKAAGKVLFNKYDGLNDQRAEYLLHDESIPFNLEKKFYDLIADEKLAGLIHSKKRTFILDAAALIISLIKNLKITGPILDIGCSIGYHCGLISKFTGLEVLGIDISKKSIAEAKRRTSKVTSGLKFKATTIDKNDFAKKIDFVCSIDSIEIDQKNIRLISKALKPNGIALLIDDLPMFDNVELKKVLIKEKLGFGFADITGGWTGDENGFDSKIALILIKGGSKPLPRNYLQQAKSAWSDYFIDFANDKNTREDKKTQAYCRAKLAVPTTLQNENQLPSTAVIKKDDILKKEIISFYTKCGINLTKDPNKLDRQLKKLMGSSRYKNYLDTTEQVHNGIIPIHYTYNCMNTLLEANTLISHQAEVFVDVSEQIYNELKPFLNKGMKVGDLGCYTGVFINWLATKHPECDFLGFDCTIKAIDFANEQNKSATNTKFVIWDYTLPSRYKLKPCDVLISSFGIDFNHQGADHFYSTDVNDLRNCKAYIPQTNEAYYFFHCWREAIKPGGKLVVVLRIGNINHFIPVIDAATDAGWKFNLESSRRFDSESERFPLLVFSAETPIQMPQKDLISWWRKHELSFNTNDTFSCCTAIEMYQSLPGKIALKEKTEVFNRNHTKVTRLGSSGNLGYCFVCATNGFTELKIVPIAKLKSLILNMDKKQAVENSMF